MLELMSYGLTGLVAIVLVAFCFACKGGFASLGDKHSSRSMDGAEFRHPENVERRTCAADTDAGPRGKEHTGVLNG